MQPVQILGGKAIFENAHLQLTSIDIHGKRNGSEVIAVSKQLTPDEGYLSLIVMDPRQPVAVEIAQGTYEYMQVDLNLYRDNYQLVLRDTLYDSNSGSEGGGGNNNNDGETDDAEDDDHDNDVNDEDNDNDDNNDDEEDDNGDDEDEGDDDDDEEDENEDDEGDRKSGVVQGKTVDLADYMQNARPSMLLRGNYRNSDKEFTLLLAVDNLSKLVLKDEANTSHLVAKNNNNIAEANFDLDHWFTDINPADLEASDLISFQGEKVLFIHQHFNNELYLKIAEKIPASIELTLSSNPNQ